MTDTPEKEKIKIIFFGTSAFAVLSLDALMKNKWRVAAVVTKPDEPAGREQTLTPPPVKEWVAKYESSKDTLRDPTRLAVAPAKRAGQVRIMDYEKKIEILQPEKLDSVFHSQLSSFTPDLFIVAAYGKIIPKEILDIPRLGTLNIHPSLLPRWRGPSPIQCAILHGDAETGVTLMRMDEYMDHGPILARRELRISNFQPAPHRTCSGARFPISKVSYPELHDLLAQLGAELLVEILPQWIEEKIKPILQDDTKATYSKLLKKDDGRINWSRPAQDIERMTRAFTPWPSAWTIWPSKKIYRIRIDRAEVDNDEPIIGSPGYVWQKENAPMLIKTGKGSISVTLLTIEGKKSMPAAAFARGYPDIAGATLV